MAVDIAARSAVVLAIWDDSRAWLTAARIKKASTAMINITTRSSTTVKAGWRRAECLLWWVISGDDAAEGAEIVGRAEEAVRAGADEDERVLAARGAVGILEVTSRGVKAGIAEVGEGEVDAIFVVDERIARATLGGVADSAFGVGGAQVPE